MLCITKTPSFEGVFPYPKQRGRHFKQCSVSLFFTSADIQLVSVKLFTIP